MWRSLDNAASWRTVVVPQTHGGRWLFAGLAGDAGHFAATIAGSAGFTPQQVTAGYGGTGRFVVTGRDQRGRAVAYSSTDNGARWVQGDGFGAVPSA